MHALIRLASVGLLALVACSKANPVPPPTFWYNDLMRQAGIQGPVRFRVRLDSVGSPELTTFQIVATPNAAFTIAVRNGSENGAIRVGLAACWSKQSYLS